MAWAVAKAGAPQEETSFLKAWRLSRDCVVTPAGRTHARNPLPQLSFAP
jgi:hypothetical protein